MISSFLQSLSFHRYAIFVAIIIACISGSLQITARNILGTVDEGMPYFVNDSEGEYLSRIQEVLDGHIRASSPVLYEYKNAPSLVLPTGEFIFYVFPARLLGFSLFTIIFLSKFIYPAVLFFFGYLFILSLLNQDDKEARISAIAGSLLIVVGHDVTNIRGLIGFVAHGSTNASGFFWNRLVNPITGGILLFAFLWLISQISIEKYKWKAVVLSSLVLSAMSGYIFSFAIGLTAPVIIAVYFIWQKNMALAFRVVIPVTIALAVNAFYFVTVLRTISTTTILSDPQKAGMFFTHEPMLNVISLITIMGIAICFIFYFRKDTAPEKEKRWWFLSAALVITCAIVYVQQIITGRTVWPQHFVQYTKPICMAVAILYLHNILRTQRKYVWRAILIFLFILSILCVWRILSTVKNTIPRYAELQSFSKVVEYLHSNAPKDCVVYVSSNYGNQINRFIPGVTSCNTYHSLYIYSGVPAERIMHNYLVNLRLRDVQLKDVKSHFFAEPNLIFSKSYFFRGWNDMFCCRDVWLARIGDKKEIDQWFTSVEKDVELKYAEYVKGDLYEQLTRYRLDYFVVDTEFQPQVNDKKYPFLSFKGQFGKFTVYGIVKH